ncbi:LacI family DNA-binding transcriptional regulator [Paramicrobacterium agarici]|uniref:LacI family transcriptional regulator n=1 Tax=Paramicrobacterium agarici TaxID=630514 RepID=A0A2A9DT98_9MICO|nr:LacI family DNA-binding transcriptional regulator [Microbacterium agarici]PFG29139.1 LacI family transcriptional regulator [Microbacterium agarici]
MAAGDARRRATNMRDVAKAAGVSHQTVSRVINDHPSLRDETKRRVLEAMATLNYRPNRAARALVTSRSHTIGVLASHRSEYGPATMIEGIENAAKDRGFSASTVNLAGADDTSIRAGLDHLLNQAVDGIVIVAPQVRVLNAVHLLQLDVPFVAVHQRDDSDQHVIAVDQVAGARQATRHLIERGHRRIAHLAGPQDWIEARARTRGFLDEMADHGLVADEPIVGDWSSDFGYSVGQRLLADRGITAVFSGNDQMALGLFHALREGGLDIPRDLSVVGFDDIPEARHFWPPLTTVRQDFTELGRRAVSRLLDDIGEAGSMPIDTIEPRLIVRQSTAGL